MNNRRGLSDVVTTVLIILLALAAVVIVWSFVRPAIVDSGEQVQGQTACFNVDVEPTGCNADTGEVSITARNANDVTEIIGIIEDDSGARTSQSTSVDGSAVVTGSVDADETAISGTPSTAYATVVIGEGDDATTCQESTVSVPCTSPSS